MKIVFTFCLMLLCNIGGAQTGGANSIYADSITSIQFVGSGNIQKAINSSNGEIPANTGIGVIYREKIEDGSKLLWLYNFELSLSINIASTVDTIKPEYDASGRMINQHDFGNSLLLPSNSGQSFNVAFKGYFDGRSDGINEPAPFLEMFSGFYLNFAGSNRNWVGDEKYVKASVLSTQIGVFHDFVGRAHRNQGYSICVGLGYTSRFILGDVAHDDNNMIRETLLGTRALSYHGAELMLALQLKNIRASVRIPWLYSSHEVPGLSGIQPNTIIGFVGGFTLALN